MRIETGRFVAAIIAVTGSAAAVAQSAVPRADSLIADPQRGATVPLPPPPVPPLVPAPVPASPRPSADNGRVSGPALPILRGGGVVSGPPIAQALPAQRPGGLPAPGADPLHADEAGDPILALARSAASLNDFRAAIGAAVARNPELGESIAQADEARGAKNEAEARRAPSGSVSLTYFNVLSRAFSDDPLNILERSRPRYRTDGAASIQQPLYDAGATQARIHAARSRLDAAIAGIDDTSSQVALRAVAAWYGVFGYRALVTLTRAFVADQRELRTLVESRVTQGYAAQGDLAQVDSFVAASQAQLADYERQLANAEAQYAQLVGSPAPAALPRAPVAPLAIADADAARAGAGTLPAVTAARRLADAAHSEARGARGDALPSLGAGLDAGRYGVIETRKDYDVRASATLTLRLGGGLKQRIEQADARARGADAHVDRVRTEAERDAAIAFADVQALQAAEAAIADNYRASRQARDVLAERFRVSRGTIFDLINADNNFYSVAARYIQTLIELDTARYALLARTGGLLDALAIQPRMPR